MLGNETRTGRGEKFSSFKITDDGKIGRKKVENKQFQFSEIEHPLIKTLMIIENQNSITSPTSGTKFKP